MDQDYELEREGPEAESQDLVIDGLEQYAEQHETETAPTEISGVDHAALAEATESQGAIAGPTASDQALGAPTAIDATQSATRTKAYEKREKQRTKDTKQRVKKRARGAEWTADKLAKIMKSQGAPGVIVALNERHAAQGIQVLKTANEWDKVVAALPAGKLQKWPRKALDQMVADDAVTVEDAKKLFLPRFNHAAEDVGGSWNMDLMKGVWRQLAVLPADDVSRNTAVTTFQAIAGGGGFGPSWEAPDTINTIQLGEDNVDGEYLEHTVRHEVGHGVHTEIPGPINQWLQDDMQFWFTDDWDKWITELGGYPDKFTDSSGTVVDFDDAWKGTMRQMVQDFTGSSSWSPAKPTPDDGEAADIQAAWAAMPAAVRNACAQSTTQWYDNYTNFQQVGNKRYFLNHWYKRPFTIGPTAYAAIASTNDTYTAMSEKEFFANCYAEYFADPRGAKDPGKWGGTLPASIKTFFKTCIVQRNPYDKFKKQTKASKA